MAGMSGMSARRPVVRRVLATDGAPASSVDALTAEVWTAITIGAPPAKKPKHRPARLAGGSEAP